jgi:LmbE family N-acetylglucosaminyl deacetylase
MLWIYISPHFDDAALSCGGLVWEQAQAGDNVSVWTVCAGKPPTGEFSPLAIELHTRWEADQNATEERRLEDLISCLRLRAGSRHFNLPDCIYRRHPQTGEAFYTSEASLNGPLHPGDEQSITELQEVLKPLISKDMILVSPLSLGNHVDHQLTRLALDGLGCPSWYYQDYPYVLHCKEKVDSLETGGWISCTFPISEQGLAAWQDSIAVHASQISTFWAGESEMRQAIADYFHSTNGIRLWRKPA